MLGNKLIVEEVRKHYVHDSYKQSSHHSELTRISLCILFISTPALLPGASFHVANTFLYTAGGELG